MDLIFSHEYLDGAMPPFTQEYKYKRIMLQILSWIRSGNAGHSLYIPDSGIGWFSLQVFYCNEKGAFLLLQIWRHSRACLYAVLRYIFHQHFTSMIKPQKFIRIKHLLIIVTSQCGSNLNGRERAARSGLRIGYQMKKVCYFDIEPIIFLQWIRFG